MLGLGKTDNQMHCLYCDRPLALLKRLTGDGEFCSKEHRRLYQQQHNQLAVARLLEAQRAAKAPELRRTKETPAPAVNFTRVKPHDSTQPQLANFLEEYSREAKSQSGGER